MEWISIKQACQISGKSESTIRRLIRKSQNTHFDYSGVSDTDSHGVVFDQADQVNMTRLICKKEAFKWLVNKENLIQLCNMGFVDDQPDQSDGQDKDKHDYSDHQDEIISLLKENNEYLKGQISELHRQVEHLHILLGRNQRLLEVPAGEKKWSISGLLSKIGL